MTLVFFILKAGGWIHSRPHGEVLVFERRILIGPYRPAYSALCIEAADWTERICNASNHVAEAAMTGGSDRTAAVLIKLGVLNAKDALKVFIFAQFSGLTNFRKIPRYVNLLTL